MKHSTLSSSPNSGNTTVSRSQFKPILFSTAMVEAIFEGRKTQTRRIVKPYPADETDISYMPNEPLDWTGEWFPYKWETEEGEIICKHPKYNVGDILWVRETWCLTQPKNPEQYFFGYKAGGPCSIDEAPSKYDYESPDIWKPSIFMPKEACRLFLEVIDIRSERLHDITGDDVLSEGVDNGKSNKAMGVRWENMQRMSFQDLWNKINKNWNENPYVWVITFKVVECPKGFC